MNKLGSTHNEGEMIAILIFIMGMGYRYENNPFRQIIRFPFFLNYFFNS